MSKRSAKKSLESQLNSYAAAAQAVASHKTPSDGRGRWPVYAAAAGSALALSTSATADIFYSGIQNITANVSKPEHFNDRNSSRKRIDIGGRTFVIGVERVSYSFGGKSDSAFLVGPSPLGTSVRTGNTGAAKRLSRGAPISAGAGLFGGNRFSTLNGRSGFYGSAVRGNFAIGQAGFAGIRLATGGGRFNYGWIQLEVNGNGGFTDSVTAIDWAYNEVPGQSIDAGQGEPATTPEPGGRSLALLAAGCLGVLAWRKHRAQRAA